MIQINKAEAAYLRANGIVEGISRTMRQKSKRKRFYMCEDKHLIALLKQYRESQNVLETYGQID